MDMKNATVYLIFILVFFIGISSCDKENNDKITRSKIVGEWLFEKEIVDTSYQDNTKSDTTIFHDDLKFIINNTDTLHIMHLNDNSISSHLLYYQPPDSLYWELCPIHVYCIYSEIIKYQILELNENSTMVLRNERTIKNKEIVKTLYFKK